MQKTLLALLVALAGAAAGFYKAGQFDARCRFLKQLRETLRRMRTVFGYRTDMQSALRDCASRASSPVRDVLEYALDGLKKMPERGIESLWLEAAQPGPQGRAALSTLLPEQLSLLEEIAQALGAHDALSQQQQLADLQRRCEQLIEAAEQERVTGGRVWRTLGLLGGMAMAIVVW